MENTFLKAEQVATVLGVSKSYAYKVIKDLNNQLKAKGYLTISGRVSKKYFMEKVCYNDVGKAGKDDDNGNL